MAHPPLIDLRAEKDLHVDEALLSRLGLHRVHSPARRNLSVGPPALEQLAFSAGPSAEGAVARPGFLMVAIGRTLDAPAHLGERSLLKRRFRRRPPVSLRAATRG